MKSSPQQNNLLLSLPVIVLITVATILSSNIVSADDNSTVDQISITVPMSCTMSGTGMDSHNTNINNGTYTPDIGTTTMHVFCNDNEGFAIYAAGYTNDEIGGENSNKLVGTNASGNSTIESGLATVAGTPDISNWAMKLAITQDSGDTSETNAFTIDSAPNLAFPSQAEQSATQASFSEYHVVPNEYTKVAHKNSNTDMTESTGGVKLTTTYAAYISKTQPADTYSGQVKYVLVHPSTASEPLEDNQVSVVYNGNGLYFDQAGTKSVNRVVYETNYGNEYGYIGDTPAILKTRNLNADGTQNGPYSEEGGTFYEGDGLDPDIIELEGASKIKMVVRYGLSRYVGINIEPLIGGFSLEEECGELCDSSINRAGTVIFVQDGSKVSIYSELGSGATNPGYDYGIYAQVYPVYDEPTEGASYGTVQENIPITIPVSGAYKETTTWNGCWYYYAPNGGVYTFWDEDEIIDYIREYADSLAGTTMQFYASNSYTVTFDANSGSGVMADQVIYQYRYTNLNVDTFTKPHYVVIGWNTEPDGSGESYLLQQGIRVPISNAAAGDTVTLYAQWGKCSPRSICYDDNDANSPTSMNKYYPGSYRDNFFLWASNYQRAGYGFAGWNTEADGSGENYGPNQFLDGRQSIGSNAEFDREGIRLYAMWVQSAGNLQNWTGCPNLNIGDITALTDTRDGNTYAVAKLADGNCWMIENLRLGSNTEMTLTTANTQSAGTLPAASTTEYGKMAVRNNNTSSPVAAMSSPDSNVYSYGNYYGWRAAINNTSHTTGTHNTSICPSGWHLPYGGSDVGEGGGNTSGGFYYLGQIIGDGNFVKYPNNFIYPGYIITSNVTLNKGFYGNYWSATYNRLAGSTVMVYSLRFNAKGSSAIYDEIYEDYASSIRCVMNN